MSELPPLPDAPPGRYRHYKGGEYEVVGVVRHSETLEPMVLYRPLGNASGLWVRPHAMFFGQVEIDGRRQPRFARVARHALPALDPLEHNRNAWNAESAAGGIWSVPVDAGTIDRARRGDWEVILTPRRPVPREWFGDVRGLRILCLASGGGQQVPVLAAAGAQVVSFDLSDEQLRKDEMVCAREGLGVRCIRGDMADLSVFEDGAFDLVFHPASNVFVPDVEVVWRECHRVLRPGGHLLAGFMNPAVFLFDHEEAQASGTLTVKYRLPYADTTHLLPEELERKISAREPLEYSHSLATQVGGQLKAGFLLTDLYEDHWLDDSWLFARHSPVAIATRAVRPGR